MKTRKDTFWELSISGLQEDFWDNEALALSYLEWKFWEEVTDEIKTRIAESLYYDDRQYDS